MCKCGEPPAGRSYREKSGNLMLCVRNLTLGYWRYLLGCYDQCSRVLAVDLHSVGLSVLIHAAETENASVYVDWCASGCHAAADRLGRRLRTPRRRCLAAFCRRISLAVSALHGDRLDLSRGLCACRLPRITCWEVQGSLCRLQTLLFHPLGTSRVVLVPAIRGESWNCLFLQALFFLEALFSATAHALLFRMSTASARQLLFASILYLPVLFCFARVRQEMNMKRMPRTMPV